ncbi:MAG: ComF family protein [Litorilituus sp.]|jgi:ComF family protein|nr:ComF family protein [Litorilituus sp.]
MEWQTIIRGYFHKLQLILGQCDLCGNATQKYPLLCSTCFEALPLFNQDLIQGDLLNWPAVSKGLPRANFDRLFSLSPYLPPFTHWLTTFKYNGRFELATIFANLLAEQWLASEPRQTKKPDYIVLSVPLHSSKWQIRGYNQAHLIAKRFAQKVQLPYQALALQRVKKNASQVGKTGEQRRNNLSKAFTVDKHLIKHCKQVVLIDDVLTTGSTVNEICKLLKSQGVETVTVVTVCLTLPK